MVTTSLFFPAGILEAARYPQEYYRAERDYRSPREIYDVAEGTIEQEKLPHSEAPGKIQLP